MSSTVKTVRVPHLGGIDAGYQMSNAYDANKPTLVLVNSFMTSTELYQDQFNNKELAGVANLLAIEPLGHGSTRTGIENFTYWDTAIMNLQVLDALGIGGKIFALGTSQGGWIVARMALLAPDKIAGILPLGTSMDYESERSRKLGCWDGGATQADLAKQWTTAEATPSFELPDEFVDFLLVSGFGEERAKQVREQWVSLVKSNYMGDDGRRRARMCSINLGSRDGLHQRLHDIRCPVLWLHGTSDVVYSVANAEDEINMFVNSPDAKVQVVESGHHFLNFSHPEEVSRAAIDFIGKYGK